MTDIKCICKVPKLGGDGLCACRRAALSVLARGQTLTHGQEDIHPDETFDVWQFFSEDLGGGCERVRLGVPLLDAAAAALHYCNCVGARVGTTARVIILDQSDMIVFEWKRSEGIVFPVKREEAATAMKGGDG